MWAFALWDGEALWLVRDRFGVKPLFYAVRPEGCFFASELTALLTVLPQRPSPLPAALPTYLAYGFVQAPYTFYEGILQVRPGHYVRITEKTFEEQAYWEPKKIFFVPTQARPLDEVEALLTESFERRLIADVPVGLFLSGGLDSSLVAALIARKARVKVPTFTLGFREKAYDEAAWAAKIAQALELPHHIIHVSPAELLPLVEKLPALYGQPFGDASALAVYVLARFTAAHVKVVLSADGGDELFGGYVRHQYALRSLQRVSRLLQRVPQLPHTVSTLHARLPRALFHNLPAKLLKLTHLHGLHYGELVQAFPEKLTITCLEEPIPLLPYAEEEPPEPWETLRGRQYLDLRVYLPDDVLQKVDRATMAHALEAREPFLDPELVSLSGSLPDSYKVTEGQTKWVLRRLLQRYLPPTLWERPKQGFAVPTEAWLRGPLAEKLKAYLYSTETPLNLLPLRLGALQDLHRRFQQGHTEYSLFFWHILVLGLWAEWYKRRPFRS
jgi:asparagine synthase (glutamine-hydrolysing)